MFTIDQIKAAHAKVKSGADFPSYIQELIQLGVRKYHNFVSDGHTEYFGENDFTISSGSKYEPLAIAAKGDAGRLKTDLKVHQQGGTNYLTFCKQAAEAGVEKWTVDMKEMTCGYYDRQENLLLVEKIPSL